MSQAKPRKGCLKSPAGSKNNSPVPSPSLGSFYTTYSANASYASFAEACADLQSEATSCRPQSRKCVSFCSEDEGLVEVHVADEWDRTPTEPAGHLSYQDILELKAIQRTLPRAQQLPDLLTGKPASHYLSAVPIGLLPLTDSSSSPNSSTPNTPLPTPVGSPHSSSPSTSSGSSPICGSPHTSPPRSPDFGPSHLHPHSPHVTRFPSPLSVSSSPSPSPESVHKSDPISTTIPSNLPTPPFRPPPNPYSNTIPSNLPTPPQRSPPTPNFFDLSHLAPSSAPTMMKRKPNFAFLPLLDTPPSSGENTPVSAIGSGAGTPRDMQSPSSDYSAMHIVGIGEGQETPTKTISREYPALAEPIPVKVSIMSQNDEPSSFSSGSSTSSYASDSDFETTSSGYTSGSPLSRTTSISSAATSVSAHMDAELDVIKSDPSSRQEEALEFFVPQFKKHRPVYEEKAGSKTGSPSDFGWGASALRDPRLTAVSSPSLAPPSPLNLDAPASISYSARTEMRISEVLDGAPAITREEAHSSFHVNADVHASALGWEEKERLRREGWSDDSGTSSPTSVRSWKRTSCEVNVEDGGRFSMPVMDWEEKERLRREACGSFSSRNSSRTGSRVGSRETSRDSERLGIEQPVTMGGEGDFGKRKKNVVEINGVEVDLDEDENDDDDKHEGMVKDDVSAKSRRNVMIINGIETALDGDDEPELVCPSVEQSPLKGVDTTPEMSNQLPPVIVPTSTPPSSSVPSSPLSDLATPTSSTTITFPKLAATSKSTPTLKSRFSIPTTASYSPLYSTKSSSPSVSRPFSPSSSSNSPFPNPRLSASPGQVKMSPRLSPSLSPKISPTVSPSSSPIALSPLKSKVMRCSSGNSNNSGTGNPGSPVWVPSA